MSRPQKSKGLQFKSQSSPIHKTKNLLAKAQSCFDRNDFEKANQLYQKVLALEPDNLIALHNLGLIALESGLPDIAAELIGAALKVNADHLGLNKNLALVYTRLNRFDDAITQYEKVLKLDHGNGEAHGELARLTVLLGDLDRAAEHYHRAFRINPSDPRNLHGLLQLDINFINEDVLETIENLLKKTDLPLKDRSSFYFALGSIYDHKGQYDEAFANYSVANLAKGVNYHPEEHESYITEIIETFSQALFEKFAGSGVDCRQPVFIVGMPRSGTTLVEQILASHPEVSAAGELTEVENMARALPLTAGVEQSYPKCLDNLSKDLIKQLAQSHESFIGGLAGTGESRVTDKMPANFLHLGLISLLFPQAHIIHCRRDPLDTCLSCYFQNFSGDHAYASDLQDLAHYYGQYERLMAHWNSVLPVPVYEVNYEQLVREPDRVCRQIIQAVGLEWQDSCREFYRTERPVHTASLVQVRQPLYRSSIERWRNYHKFIHLLKSSQNSQGTSD